jgi:hypothetical protein
MSDYFNYCRKQVVGGINEFIAENSIYAEDQEVLKRFPKITKILEQLSPYLDRLMIDIDLDISGEKTIENVEEFENIQIEKFINIIKQQKCSFLQWDWQ